ncbi:hypothetical protein LguiB_011295 [Lonicera macranthoides]
MATAAFKSSSRRGSLTSDNSNSSNKKEIPPPTTTTRRTRSLSVSAISRSRSATQLDIRDNPLFCSAENKETQQPPLVVGGGGSCSDNSSYVSNNANAIGGGLTSKPANAGERGRSATRNSRGGGSQKEGCGGRSLSRVDFGRRGRSVSRAHFASAASESEVEQESDVSSNYRHTRKSNIASSNVKKPNMVASTVNSAGNARSLRSQSHRHPSVEPSDCSTSSRTFQPNSQIPNWEDGVSTGSLSEAEEKTIKAVCEQMMSNGGDHVDDGDTGTTGIYETVRSEVRRAISDIQNDLETAIRRNNNTAIATADITDIPPDLVNPGAVELVLDIRREYARKLEESQERARKLRADLAVEEHHGQELSRILKEILPNPKTSTVQKSRLARRTSSERKKMSKRLTEEAMSYFDECVSISTFDSSDFSAPEDPPPHSSSAQLTTTAIGRTATPQEESPCISASFAPNSSLINEQESVGQIEIMHSGEESILTASSSSNEATIAGRKSHFSFSHKPTEDMMMMSYIKNFEKDGFVSSDLVVRSNYREVELYNLHAESLLFDRVLLKNRTESGSLHICGGGSFSFPFSPFASVI